MTIDAGTHSTEPVRGLDYLANNVGSVRNVTITTASTNPESVGLFMGRKWPGPALIKNVTINGFGVGIAINHNQYGMTLENITLNDQLTTGLYNVNNVPAIRNLTVTNTATDTASAITATGTHSFVTLIGANITGHSATSTVPALDMQEGEYFIRDISIDKYDTTIDYHEGALTSSLQYIYESPSVTATSVFTSPAESLRLPIRETPAFPPELAVEWVSITDYGADGHGATSPVFNNGEALQNTHDSKARGVYWPRGRYSTASPVTIGGSVRRLDKGNSQSGFKATAEFCLGGEGPESGEPLSDIINGTYIGSTMYVERGDVWRGLNPGVTPDDCPPIAATRHDVAKTLVFRNGVHGWHDATVTSTLPGINETTTTTGIRGNIFFEDVQPGKSSFANRNVWARQLDSESATSATSVARIINDAGNFWVLGYKSERPKPNVDTRNGGQSEILGALFAPVNENLGAPAFIHESDRSNLSASFAITAFDVKAQYDALVQETRDGVTSYLVDDLPGTGVVARGDGVMVPLYTGVNIKGFWRFEEGDFATSSTVADFSGNGNDGTATGTVSWVPGRIGQYALHFDGSAGDAWVGIEDDTSDKLSFGNTATDSPFTIAAWINMDSVAGFPVFMKGSNSGEKEYDFGISNPGKLFFYIFGDSDSEFIRQTADTAFTTADENKWMHVIATYDGGGTATGMTMYVDGVVRASTPTQQNYTAMHDTDEHSAIGQVWWNGGTFADGTIDDVRVYDRAISPAEINALSSPYRE